MKKLSIFIICVCAMCGWSCTNGEMQVKKQNCQNMCDSLSVAETRTWVVENVEIVNWKDKNVSTVIVGTVPVPVSSSQKKTGSVLFMDNGQMVLTTYLNVPIGTLFVQRPVYAPKKSKKVYEPSLVKYEHYLWYDNIAYEMDNFKLI